MPSRSRIITASFFLLLSLLPVLMAIAFIARQQYVQWSMKEALEKQSLSTITISAKSFKWYKKGKEIIHNRHLFDVKSIEEVAPGVLLIKGLYDYQEDQLHKQVAKNYEHGKTDAKSQQFLQKLLTIVAIEPITHSFVATNYFNKSAFNSRYNYILPTFKPDLVTPPPQS